MTVICAGRFVTSTRDTVETDASSVLFLFCCQCFVFKKHDCSSKQHEGWHLLGLLLSKQGLCPGVWHGVV